MKEDGFDMMWLPPAYKGASGARSVGYDVYDTYDLGEFDQKDTVATKYGTKEEYLNAVKALQEQGIEKAENLIGKGAGQSTLSAGEEISNTKFIVHGDIPFA